MDIDRYVSRLSDDNLMMLLLHGVIREQTDLVRNYNRKHILESEFHDLMVALKKKGTPLDIDEFIDIQSQDKSLPSGSFVVTFDDGFENNYSVAAPILKALDIPAIIYVTTKFIDDNLMSWIDQVDLAVQTTERKILNLSFVDYPVDISSVEAKIQFLNFIRTTAKGDRNFFNRIDLVIDEICTVCDLPRIKSADGPLDKKMNWAQVRELAHGGLIKIGGHTHTHPVMSYLSDQGLEDEVSICLSKIDQGAAQKTTHFCYPEGLAHCYNDKVIDCLKEHNVVCSPTAIDGVNPVNTDLFHLRRVFII